MKRQAIPEEIKDVLTKDLETGLHAAAAAKKYGINEGSLRYFIRINNISATSAITYSKTYGKDIEDLASKGHQVGEIARILNASYVTISSYCKKNNIKIVKAPKTKAPIELQEKVKELAIAGVSCTKIARDLSIGKNVVKNICKHWNITLKPGSPKRMTPWKKTSEIESEILTRIQRGDSAKQIYRELGVASKTIHNIAKRNSTNITIGYSGKFNQDELNQMLNKQMEFTGVKKSGIYEVRCKIHSDEIYNRAATDLDYGCIRCNNTGSSKAQEEMFEWIRSLGLDVTEKTYISGAYNLSKNTEKRFKDILGEKLLNHKKEMDGIIYEKNIAIEYNGLYFHSYDLIEKRVGEHIKKNLIVDVKDIGDKLYAETVFLSRYFAKRYHLHKTFLAKQNGLRLIHVFEDEWKEKKEQVKSFLKSTLGRNSTMLNGRDCEVVEICTKEANEFVDKYHIQGGTTHQKSFALKYKEEIVGVMSFGKHHRKNGDTKETILHRLCFKENVTVRGGASKLFSKAKEWAKSSGYSCIRSWSDNRWSEGNVYTALGFTPAKESLDIDYHYVKGGKRFNKQGFKSIQLKHPDKGSTEAEVMKNLGYSVIWDCGKKAWLFPL